MNSWHLGAALSLGLITGLHCIGMCGPLALALPAAGEHRWSFVAGRLLYNLGRAVTYAIMGLMIGVIGVAFSIGGFQRWFSIFAGSLILISLALIYSGVMPRMMEATGFYHLFGRLQNAWRKRFNRNSIRGLFVLGLINGLLPCGPVYAALAAAAVTGHASTSALFMFVFGLGTLPMMLAVSLAGKLIQMPIRRKLQKLVPISAGVVAILLIVRGLALGIPYLSPPVTATQVGAQAGTCCQGGH